MDQSELQNAESLPKNKHKKEKPSLNKLMQAKTNSCEVKGKSI